MINKQSRALPTERTQKKSHQPFLLQINFQNLRVKKLPRPQQPVGWVERKPDKNRARTENFRYFILSEGVIYLSETQQSTSSTFQFPPYRASFPRCRRESSDWIRSAIANPIAPTLEIPPAFSTSNQFSKSSRQKAPAPAKVEDPVPLRAAMQAALMPVLRPPLPIVIYLSCRGCVPAQN